MSTTLPENGRARGEPSPFAGYLEPGEPRYPELPEQRARRAAVRRRELELSIGERFARMLPPAEGGAAA